MTGAVEGSGRGTVGVAWLAQWKAVEGGPLDWRDWRGGRQWKGDRWSGVTGAVGGGQLEWCD